MSARLTFLMLLTGIVTAPAVGGLDARELHVRHLLGEGRYLEGFRNIAEVVERSPDGNRFYLLLAEAGQYAGRSTEADTLLTACARRGRDLPSALSALGWLDLHQGRLRDAHEHFKAAVSIGGASAGALAGIQETEEKLYGGEVAIAHLLALSHAREGAGPVWYALALAYWGQWDLDRAWLAIERALRSGSPLPRQWHLRHAIECARDPGPRSLDHAASALARAYETGDWEGVVFMHWVRMNAFAEAGAPDSARKASEDGLRIAKHLGLLAWEGQFHLQAGRVAIARGEIPAAIAAVDSASHRFSIAGESDGTLAAYSLRMGILIESSRYPEALEYGFRALHQFSDRTDPRLHAGAAIDAAWMLAQIGGQRIALVLGVYAETILERFYYAAHDRGRLNCVLARVHASLGDLQAAARYASTGLQIAASQAEDHLLLANVEGVLGEIAYARGDTAIAIAHFSRQWEAAQRVANPGEKKTAALALARMSLARGNTRAAVRWTDTSYALSLSTGDRLGESECHMLRGTVAVLSGRAVDARGEFAAARHCLSGLRRLRLACSLTREMREWYLHQHVRLAQGLLRAGDVRNAAVVMTLARLDVQPWLRWPGDGGPAQDGATERTMERARRRTSAMIHHWVLGGQDAPGVSSDSLVQTLRLFFCETLPAHLRADERVLGLQSTPEMQHRIPEVVGGTLSPDEVAIEFLFGERETDALLLTRDSIWTERIAAGQRAFARLADCGEAGNDGNRPATRAEHQRLIGTLAAFFGRSLGTRNACVIVGSGLQTRVPFGACVSDTRLAGRISTANLAFRHVPSLLGVRTSEEHASGETRVLVVGDAYAGAERDGPEERVLDPDNSRHVSGLLEPLPGTRTEIGILTQLFGQHIDVLRGADATLENVRLRAPYYAIVHVAAHGVARMEEGSEHAIFLSGSDRSSGVLRIEDVLAMELGASLVVLPVCYSGLPSQAGDVGSFAEAFLEAGAGSVLAARGAVDDERTAEYVEGFYAALARGESRGRAAQCAAEEMVRRGRIASVDQAGFMLYGDGGRVAVRPASEGGKNRWWLILVAALTISSAVVWFAWKKVRTRN